MRAFIKHTAAPLIIITALLSMPAHAAGEKIGVNAAVKGDVTIQSPEQLAKQAVLKEPVSLGDKVTSNEVGSLQVMLLDQTTFTVGPECELIIDEYVYNPSSNSNSMKAKVSKGMFRFMSGNISKSGPDSVSVDTPVASMGVRGTMAEGLLGAGAIEIARDAGVLGASAPVDLQHASLFVLRGPGRKNTSGNRRGEIAVTSAGTTRLVRKAGWAVFVADASTPPSAPFPLSDAAFDTFSQNLRTIPARRTAYRPFDIEPGILPRRNFEQPDNTRRGDDEEFINPEADLDFPVEIIDDSGRPDDFICTPLNPNFPNC